jgi:hypothetical protein
MSGGASYPVLKGGFCVSTVSIVCGRAPGSMAIVAGCTYWTGRRLARPRIVIGIADDADGIFRPRMDPDHLVPVAFMTGGNLNTPYSKERLRTTQAVPLFLGQPLAPLERRPRTRVRVLPFDASQLTFISISSQVTRVAPARARAASKAQIPDLRRDSARRSYRSMAVTCRSERTVAMHLNVHDEAELRVDKTPVLPSRWLVVH